MFYGTDNTVGYKMSLRKLFQKIEIIPRIYSNHKSMKQKIKDRKKICKRKMWTLHIMLLPKKKKKKKNKLKRKSENI